MKKIITYGTFDLLHYGHIELLRRAKAMGEYLIVGLSTDEFNKEKGKTSFFDYKRRYQYLSYINLIDEIIPEKSWHQKPSDIKDNNVDVFVMGNDWQGKFDELLSYCEVVYLERTADISSSAIKSNILNDN